MTIGTSKSPNPKYRNSISVIKSKFLSVSSMNTLLAILKVTDARRDVILAGGLYHRFPWSYLTPPPPPHPGCCHSNEMRPLPISLASVFLATGNLFFQNNSRELYPPILAASMFGKFKRNQ